jgi:hypothetical protein
MRLSNIIDEILYEKKNKTLNLFYNVDIFIQGFKQKEEPEVEPVKQEKPEEPAKQEKLEPKVESKTFHGNFLVEDIFKTKNNGSIVVPEEDADNIQTLEDLVEYLSDANENGKPVLNDLTKEIIISLAGIGEKAVDDLVSEGDKIVVDIDYGADKNNSIGVRINKSAGSNTISIVMKKDNQIIPSEFSLPEFNKQLVFFRNSIISG